MWGTLSGITEPFGALLTWLVLNGDMGGIANGLLFGIVAGMMTVISVQELLPNAHKYANQNGMVVTLSFLFGAFCIAASLMLFSV
jgi:ZIP family zinc transporter